ncbi:MAG: nuoM, partial [Pedosphaera sp.]|nr:nuoM [Pedosphaera sp.]
MSPLTYIILWPLVAALLLCLVPRNYGFLMRIIAMVVTFITMILAIKMFWQFDGATVGASGYRFEQKLDWVTALGISYHVGVDGINVGLILMGAIVAFAA